jgi:hypothetical protein
MVHEFVSIHLLVADSASNLFLDQVLNFFQMDVFPAQNKLFKNDLGLHLVVCGEEKSPNVENFTLVEPYYILFYQTIIFDEIDEIREHILISKSHLKTFKNF